MARSWWRWSRDCVRISIYFPSGTPKLTVFNSGTFYYFGGLLMIVATVLEFILGNTFVFVVFGSLGVSK
jgi:succinate-acetate transporter protein